MKANDNLELGNTSAKKIDVSYHYPLYIASYINGLCPPIKLSEYRVKTKIYYKCYSLLLIIIIASYSSYCQYGKILYCYQYILPTAKTNDVLVHIILTYSSCLAILKINFLEHNSVKLLFEKLKTIDTYFSTIMDLKEKKKVYNFRFVIFHFIIALLCIADYLIWTNAMIYELRNLWIYSSFFFYMIYANLIVVLQLVEYASNLQTRFSIVNEKLLDTFMHCSGDFDQNMKMKVVKELSPSSLKLTCRKYLPVKDLRYIHDLLCDIVDQINNIYGVNICMFVLNIILISVLVLNAGFLFATATGLPLTFHPEHTKQIVLLSAFFLLFFGVSIDFISISV